jgi:predicted O-methyltransferase YrrM
MSSLPADSLDIQKQLLSRAGFIEAVNNGAGIALEYAVGLYRAVLTKRPKTMLEIGMADGAASLTILSALSQLGGERLLISIDPNQSTQWHNAGVNNVKANGFSGMHRLIEEPDYVALPELLRQQLALDAAYVDGWHTFDYVLLDFFYIDKLLPVGGIVGFNDCGWRAIRRALRFVVTHRKYTELDVGLEPNYRGRNLVASVGRRVLNQVNNDRWFTKAANWEPAGSFYASF